MTPEQQRIAIARECGIKPQRMWRYWYNSERTHGSVCFRTKEQAAHQRHVDISNGCYGWDTSISAPEEYDEWGDAPDYLNDLNACHEMEQAMDREQAAAYHDFLRESTPSCATMKCWADRWTYHANAAQRCEAFLRAKNLWKD